MNIFFAMLEELPVRDRNRRAYVQNETLPSGVPITLINPANLDNLVAAADKRAKEMSVVIHLICVDLQEIYNSDFVSPSAAPNMPEWYSVN